MNEVIVVGGGLAGCEAAWQLARRGIPVRLIEMRPERMTGAHRTGCLAELVCSNSLGSSLPDRAAGWLVDELSRCGSLLIEVARECAVPAGGALAVDRDRFACTVTHRIEAHPNIHVERREVTAVPPPPCILATGPLTSPALSGDLERMVGQQALFFYDAIAPIVAGDSLDRSIVFSASRRGRGVLPEGDYLNCPFTREEYDRFVEALRTAERAPLAEFEREIDQGVKAGEGPFFEGCLPIEVLAARNPMALAYGPLRPVGLRDPRTGRRPWAVLQLRREDLAGERYNLVGCQTNLRVAEQERVFRMVPGLSKAQFLRYGQMHRNTFLNAPRLLQPDLSLREHPGIWVAGQLAGIEGYLGNIATGLVAGIQAARWVRGQPPIEWPTSHMIGALLNALCHSDPAWFQPIKANFGLLPPLPETPSSRAVRLELWTRRALEDWPALKRELQRDLVESVR